MSEGCAEYRPDHNGECLNCDEPLDAHDDDAVPPALRACPDCGRIMSIREWVEQRICNDCAR